MPADTTLVGTALCLSPCLLRAERLQGGDCLPELTALV
jgi:hypothetical protein